MGNVVNVWVVPLPVYVNTNEAEAHNEENVPTLIVHVVPTEHVTVGLRMGGASTK